MSNHPESKITNLQSGGLVVGFTLLITSIVVYFKFGGAMAIALAVGAMGWFLLCLMMSQQARKDMFGSRFENGQITRH